MREKLQKQLVQNDQSLVFEATYTKRTTFYRPCFVALRRSVLLISFFMILQRDSFQHTTLRPDFGNRHHQAPNTPCTPVRCL